MKEIALVGLVSHVQAEILGHLLREGLSVNVLTDKPERVMLDDSRLTVQPLTFAQHGHLAEALEGYHDAVFAYNDDLADAYSNDDTLHHFAQSVAAARQAGVQRLIVVGSHDSQAFFVSDLRRTDDIDWVFISTEGDYATRVVNEIINPRNHKEIYAD